MRLIFVSEANNSPLFVLLLVGWFRSSGQPTQHETVLKDDQVSMIIIREKPFILPVYSEQVIS